MATTAQTSDQLAISRIIYFTDNDANGVDENPPFIPVNAPGIPGAGICYGGVPTGNQTVTVKGSGYTVGNVYPTQIVNDGVGGTTYTGTNLTVTANATLNGGGGTTVSIANAGTGYITGQKVEVLGNEPGAKRAVLTIVGAAANEQALIDANKEAQLEQCQRLYPFNPITETPYSQVANGSNVVGIGDLSISAVTASAGDAPAAAGVYMGLPFWNDDGNLVLQADIVPTAAGTGTDANRTITWSATGAGLTANAGSAVPGQPLQRSFAIPDRTAGTYEQLDVTCTVTYTDAAGASTIESFLIFGGT